MEKSQSSSTSRETGIELFRIVAMLLIVLLHVLGRGGVYGGAEYLGVNYKLAWLLNTAAYCSVNCYALISGYVGIHSRFRFRKIVYLWLEVVCITLSITALFAVFSITPVSGDDWIKAAFPLIKREFWYFNAYALMFPFIPLLNKGLTSISRRQHLITMAFLFVLTTILPKIGDRDLFELSSGYSGVWLMVLYLFGAYFRLYGIPKLASPAVCLATFLGATLVAWAQKVDLLPWGENGFLIGYTSPCMVVMAVALLCLFARVNVKGKLPRLVVTNLGKATFGVFIVHVSALVWNLIDDRWARFGEMPPLKMVLCVVGTTLSVYLVCSAYSLLRIWLFKICRVHKLVDTVADQLSV